MTFTKIKKLLLVSAFLNPGHLPTTNDGCSTADPVRLYSSSPHPNGRRNCNDFLFCLTSIKIKPTSISQPLADGSSSVSVLCTSVSSFIHSFTHSLIYPPTHSSIRSFRGLKYSRMLHHVDWYKSYQHSGGL